MNSFRNIFNIILITLTCLSTGIGQSVVTPDRDRFDKFTGMDNLWNAADATISINLPDNKTLWLFGDTFAGPHSSDYTMNPSEVKMIRNSAILEGAEMNFLFSGTEEDPSSWIPDRDTSFFWPEHGILEEDTLRVFAIEVFTVDNGNPGFNFETGSTHIASFSYPEMEHISTLPVTSLSDSTMRFGTQVFREEGYTYIFGKRDTTENNWTWTLPYLARTQGSVTGTWEFFAGDNQWSENNADAIPVGDHPVGESFSVIKQNGFYYMLLHEIWMVQELYILKAEAITGPWNRATSGGIEKKFAVLESQPDNFTYNLFAHPQFEEDGKILFSVNVNTSDFSSVFDDTRNYRARFYRVSPEEAVQTDIPDTLNMHSDFENTLSIGEQEQIATDNIRFSNHNQTIVFGNVEGLFRLVDLNGRVRMTKKVFSGERIKIQHLPNQMYIVVLTTENGNQVRKILKYKT